MTPCPNDECDYRVQDGLAVCVAHVNRSFDAREPAAPLLVSQ